MSTRSQAYRRAMPMHIFPLIRVASRVTLYLVNQSGPTSFTFKDRLGAKHKATIGNTISCSCQMRANDHCLHTIYILIRLFKIPIDNPLIWQNSFLDSELTDIVAGKYSAQNISFPVISEMLTPCTEFMQPTKILHNIEAIVERKPMKQESECPICQQPMGSDSCITFCKVGCGNNFHLSCLKIWIQHKQSTEGKVTCPMCRCEYSELWIQSIRAEQRKFMQDQQRLKIRSMKFSCQSCGKKELVGLVYKCLYCQNYCLCFDCFLSKKHIKHPFIMFNGQEWQGAEDRIQQNKRLRQFLQQKRKQQYKAQQIIQKIKKINFQPAKILDFVAGSYPYVSQYISQHIDPYSKLDFNPQDIVCFHCGSTRMIFLRRLPCGHFIDHNCLKECITNKKFYCDKDGSKFLKGYENLLKHQQQETNIIAQSEKIEQKLSRPPPRRSSFDEYNFRIHEQEESEPENQQTLLSIFGAFQNIRESNIVPTNPRLEQNIRKNMVVNIPPVSNNNNNQIRVRNLSLNTRKPPKPAIQIQNKNKKRTNAILDLAVSGQTVRRNQSRK